MGMQALGGRLWVQCDVVNWVGRPEYNILQTNSAKSCGSELSPPVSPKRLLN